MSKTCVNHFPLIISFNPHNNPLVRSLTTNLTSYPLVHGVTLQPREPHQPGRPYSFLIVHGSLLWHFFPAPTLALLNQGTFFDWCLWTARWSRESRVRSREAWVERVREPACVGECLPDALSQALSLLLLILLMFMCPGGIFGPLLSVSLSVCLSVCLSLFLSSPSEFSSILFLITLQTVFFHLDFLPELQDYLSTPLMLKDTPCFEVCMSLTELIITSLLFFTPPSTSLLSLHLGSVL